MFQNPIYLGFYQWEQITAELKLMFDLLLLLCVCNNQTNFFSSALHLRFCLKFVPISMNGSQLSGWEGDNFLIFQFLCA